MAEDGIDELNLGIIRALQLSPRTTNKDLAERLGVAEATIASRIRGMEEQRILRIMMQRDMNAMGRGLIALVDIRVERRNPEAVAIHLAEIEEAISVSVMMSNPDIIVSLGVRDGHHLQEVIDRKIAKIPGIVTYEITAALDVLKFDARYGALDAER